MVSQRLSIFAPSLAGGGAERVVCLVAGGLAARGVDVTLVLCQASGSYLADVDSRVRVVDLGASSMPQALLPLVRHLREARPTALLAAMSHANVTAALAHCIARSRARLILSEHAHLSSVLTAHPGWRMRATALMMRWTYPRADRIVSVSDGVTTDLLQRIPLDTRRVVTIYNPVVDDTLRARAKAQPACTWLSAQAPCDPPVVLAAGRLVPQKDFATLIEAFALLRHTRPARLLILGEGDLRAPLTAQVARLGLENDVALPGFEPNPFSAMRAAQLFVLSSRFEGLGCVLIEAMACGTPVVSTDCPSGPHEVLEGGRWGRLVPVGDVKALAAAMAAALDDPSPPDVSLRAEDFSVARAVERYVQELGVT